MLISDEVLCLVYLCVWCSAVISGALPAWCLGEKTTSTVWWCGALWCEGECMWSRSSSGRVVVRGSGGSAAASAGHCQSLPVSRR